MSFGSTLLYKATDYSSKSRNQSSMYIIYSKYQRRITYIAMSLWTVHVACLWKHKRDRRRWGWMRNILHPREKNRQRNMLPQTYSLPRKIGRPKLVLFHAYSTPFFGARPIPFCFRTAAIRTTWSSSISEACQPCTWTTHCRMSQYVKQNSAEGGIMLRWCRVLLGLFRSMLCSVQGCTSSAILEPLWEYVQADKRLEILREGWS